MANLERGSAPDEGAQELTPLGRVRKAVREARRFAQEAQESETQESKNLGKALEIVGLLENLVQYVEKNPEAEEAVQIENMILGYSSLQRGLKAREKDKGRTEGELNPRVGDWRPYDELKKSERKAVEEIMELARKIGVQTAKKDK
jgi:hypothetical protein